MPATRRPRLAVAAPNALSADAALRTGAAGGTAVDAAVAAMLTAMVTEPGVVSLTAGAYLTVWPAGAAEAVVVDAYVTMPGLDPITGPPDLREITSAYGGGVTMIGGHGSVAVPGALAGFDAAVSRWGALPWAEVLAPAYEAARDGFPLGSAAGYYLGYVGDSLFGWDEQTADALRDPAGGLLATGARVRIPDLAPTLERLATVGAVDLYRGELAAAVVADMAARGGAVGRRDLAEYRPELRAPLPARVGDWSLRTNPPPAIGGAVLAAMLSLLPRGGELTAGPTVPAPAGGVPADPGPADSARLAAVQRRVLDVRYGVLDVAADRDAAAYALLRDVGWAPEAPSTVHVSVVDAEGTGCAITASSGYGSGATVPGTGLWLNNCLGELELNRGAPLPAGQRLRSNMTPSVARHADGGVLAIGSPGADRITTALLQVLAPFAETRLDLQAAVDRPRLHVRHSPDAEPTVQAEEDLDLPDPVLLADGRAMAVHRHHRHSMYFGGVGAALRAADGSLSAAADPRRAGVAVTA